jgi:hypothetical protein
MKVTAWWKAWGDLVQRLVALTASFASLAGLLVAFLPHSNELPWWAVTLLVSGTFFLAVSVVLELLGRRGRSVYAKNDTDGIKRYMHDWITNGGRVAIWTRDMSWAQNAETQHVLKEKARRGELILCLPEPNGLAADLAAAGAEICAYGADRLESPASRFTIAFFGRAGSRVAVGHANRDVHVIEEFAAGEHPAFYLLEDLITLARRENADGRMR